MSLLCSVGWAWLACKKTVRAETTYTLGTLLLHSTATKHAAHAAAAKELRKQVFCRDTATHARIAIEPFLAVLVVDGSLLGIRQDLVARKEVRKGNPIFISFCILYFAFCILYFVFYIFTAFLLL